MSICDRYTLAILYSVVLPNLSSLTGVFMSLINTTVQPFKVQAFHDGKFVELTEQSLKGKWSAFIFMPAAFTFNCPTEVEDAADNYAEFKTLEAEVQIVTTDNHFA